MDTAINMVAVYIGAFIGYVKCDKHALVCKH